MGQYIPGLAGNRAFLAHWAMTLDLYRKQDIVQSFFNPAWPDDKRQQTLATYQIRYVLWGQAEQSLGSLDPASLPYLTEVFSAPKAKLYQVNLDSIGGELNDSTANQK